MGIIHVPRTMAASLRGAVKRRISPLSDQEIARVGTSRSKLLVFVVMYSFQCRIQMQNTVQNTKWRIFQRYSAQELVHIYLRRAFGTRVRCTLVQNAQCKYI